LLIGWGGEHSKACLFRVFHATFLPPGYGAGPLWNEEGFMTFYQTRVVGELLCGKIKTGKWEKIRFYDPCGKRRYEPETVDKTQNIYNINITGLQSAYSILILVVLET
jgi:hypothetical protein